MYHFFVKPEQIAGGEARITGADVNHIANVLRMKPGEEVMVSDGSGWEYLCRIRETGREEILLEVREENSGVSELPVRITLYQGLPKSAKMELIIQKAVELGVSRVVPVETRRTVVHLDKRRAESKGMHWQSVAESAAKQSGRLVIPEVSLPVKFSAALSEAEADDVRLSPYELAEGMDRTRRLISSIRPGMRVSVFIGPEGGFAEEEIREAEAHGFAPVTLGRRILRTETAGLVMLSLLMAEAECQADSGAAERRKAEGETAECQAAEGRIRDGNLL